MQEEKLDHQAAIRKWGHYMDAAIGGKDAPLKQRMEALVNAGATYAKLKSFWTEVKHLEWPEFDDSPWSTAAYLAAAYETRDLGPQFLPVGREHVDAFQNAHKAKSATILAWKAKPLKGCIQCIDRVSGKTGCFLHYGDLHAISPVFDDLTGLFAYMHEKGLRIVPATPFDVEAIDSMATVSAAACAR